MPKYFDPISQQELDIEHSTIVYLVKTSENTFFIKAISEGLEYLRKDPTSNSTTYWLIDTDRLLVEQSENKRIFGVDQNMLSANGLTVEEVNDYLGINTEVVAPTSFDPNGHVAGQLQHAYAEHMDGPLQNQYSFFGNVPSGPASNPLMLAASRYSLDLFLNVLNRLNPDQQRQVIFRLIVLEEVDSPYSEAPSGPGMDER